MTRRTALLTSTLLALASAPTPAVARPIITVGDSIPFSAADLAEAIATTEPAPPRAPPQLVEIHVDAAELYKRAEAALAVRDHDTARDQLERLLREYPSDARADAARYDLALLARAAGDHAIALDLLDTIIRRGADTNLRSAARELRDSIARSIPR